MLKIFRGQHKKLSTFVLLFQCRDRKGIVAGVSRFIYDCGGNIITADQHTTDPEGGDFFMRVEFVLEDKFGRKPFLAGLPEVAARFKANWRLYDQSQVARMGILVSGPDHCLREILYLWSIQELRADIAFVISNRRKHSGLVRQYGIPFHYIPSHKNNRKEAKILSYSAKTDFLVLARYMLVLSRGFLKIYGRDIINIHHGFLPSFRGANPYQKALDEGVKVIGATAHFVNVRLDQGPIISQEVAGVSHKDGLAELVQKGRDLERKALSSALASYLDHRLIRCGNKTIVF